MEKVRLKNVEIKEKTLKCPRCGIEGINTIDNLLDYSYDPLYGKYVSVYTCPCCNIQVSL